MYISEKPGEVSYFRGKVTWGLHVAGSTIKEGAFIFFPKSS